VKVTLAEDKTAPKLENNRTPTEFNNHVVEPKAPASDSVLESRSEIPEQRHSKDAFPFPVAQIVRTSQFKSALIRCGDSRKVTLRLLPINVPPGTKIRFDGDARFNDDRNTQLLSLSPLPSEIKVTLREVIDIALELPPGQTFGALNVTLPIVSPGQLKQIVSLLEIPATQYCETN